MNIEKLVKSALKAKENAYARYSGFLVGAALLTKEGDIFTGCNIENASYGASMCAERVAMFKALSEGKREFKAIAIAAASEFYVTPCGICRQVLNEFINSDFKVVCSNNKGEYKIYKMDELLPHAFGSKNFFEKRGNESSHGF